MAAVTRKSNKFINFRKILNINVESKNAGLGPYELDHETERKLSLDRQKKLMNDMRNADKTVFRVF